VLLVIAAIFVVSSMPERPPTPGMREFRWDDKVQHFAAYALLGALAWRALGNAVGKMRRLCYALLIAAGYGLFDEWHQSWVPGRSCSGFDLAADTLGSAIAAFLLNVWKGGNGSGRKA